MPLLTTIADYVKSGKPVIEGDILEKGLVVHSPKYGRGTVYLRLGLDDEDRHTSLIHEFLHLDCMNSRTCHEDKCRAGQCPREEEFEELCKQIYASEGLVINYIRLFVRPIQEHKLKAKWERRLDEAADPSKPELFCRYYGENFQVYEELRREFLSRCRQLKPGQLKMFDY